MFTNYRIMWVIFSGLILLLNSCGSRTNSDEAESQIVFTSAAETANAMITELSAATPTEQSTATIAPTITPTETPTIPEVTFTLTDVPLAGTLVDRAEFIADVTVPDGSNYAGGSAFTKTWRLKNIGTSTWTSAYSLMFFNGDQMGAPDSIPLQNDVPPGQTVDLSVDMIAPNAVGQYTSLWILRSPLGRNFGVGINADQPFYVLINVTTPGNPQTTTSPTTTTNPMVTTTPATVGAGPVSDLSLTINNKDFTGKCPHIFTFQAQITLSQPTTLTFQLEAGSTTPGFIFNLPAPTTAAMEAGTHNMIYELTINQNMSAWARLHITSPVDKVSPQLDFSLTCN